MVRLKKYVFIFFSVSDTIESNKMVLDESIDSSNNASDIVVNESPQTKLFSIFTNQTPPASYAAW